MIRLTHDEAKQYRQLNSEFDFKYNMKKNLFGFKMQIYIVNQLRKKRLLLHNNFSKHKNPTKHVYLQTIIIYI